MNSFSQRGAPWSASSFVPSHISYLSTVKLFIKNINNKAFLKNESFSKQVRSQPEKGLFLQE